MGPTNTNNVSFKLLGPDGKSSVEVKLSGDSIDYERILNELFAKEFLREAAIGWLQQKQKIYSLSDERLASAIADVCGSLPPTTSLQDYMTKAKECANKAVVARLRTLAFDHRPPFHYIGIEAQAGFPARANERPPSGHANVCKDGGFFGKTVQVSNPIRSDIQPITVEADRQYVCTHLTSYPDIQLSKDAFTSLFGNKPLSSVENVIIAALN